MSRLSLYSQYMFSEDFKFSHRICVCYVINIGPGLTSELFGMSQLFPEGPPLKIRFSVNSESIYCEISCLVSDSAHTSIFIAKLKHLTGATT